MQINGQQHEPDYDEGPEAYYHNCGELFSMGYDEMKEMYLIECPDCGCKQYYDPITEEIYE
jgi:hypothetical protein